jgi:spermidine synthase
MTLGLRRGPWSSLMALRSARPLGDVGRLFATSALLLFVELVLIRWIPANVIFFGYFSNLILMASFLGIGVGILFGKAHRAGVSAVDRFPPFALTLLLIVGVIGTLQVNLQLRDPGAVFFGLAESSQSDIGFVVIPVVVALVTLLMASLALPLGRLLTSMPPLKAYGVDVAGSMAGIGVFALMSILSTPPAVWFAVVALGLGILGLGLPLNRRSILTGASMAGVIALSLVAQAANQIWSPYYRIDVTRPGSTEVIAVNGVPHQAFSLTSSVVSEEFYFQIYRWLPERTFQHALIVGAGSGNDVAIALRQRVGTIDAVEIDPQILAIGARDHPLQPYADSRVETFTGDGRAFLRNSTSSYDLIVFALPDSLTLIGSTANIRLESFLFTKEAFASVRDHLAPDGVFVLYNLYREDWVVAKIERMLTETFGRAPAVRAFTGELSAAVIAVGPGLDGVTGDMSQLAALESSGRSPPAVATDDWPFVYLAEPSIAPVYIVALLLVLAWAGLITFRAARVSATPLKRFSPHFFVLGSAFMLLETRSLVTFSLLFGTTWFVNALVFFAVLASVLLAILINARLRLPRPSLLYAGLFASIALAYLLPPQTLLIDPPALRYALAAAIAFAPVFFANLVFTYSFRDTKTADMAFASNLLGAMVGAVLEYASLVVGYRALLLLVAGLYLLANAFAGRLRVLADADLVAGAPVALPESPVPQAPIAS